jgi:hypothetical protein
MAVSVILRVMAVTFRSGLWFGLEVGFWVAIGVLAGPQGVPEVGPGGRVPLLKPGTGGDDDHVVRRPAAAEILAGFAAFPLFGAIRSFV